MKNYVFDSFAIIAFYADEKGSDLVEKILTECLTGKARGWMTVINWGEIFYATAKVKGLKVALDIMKNLESYPLIIVDADKNLTWEAAKLKAKYPIAYADCFALALAKQKEADLLTGDPEFRKVKENVKIIWLA